MCLLYVSEISVNSNHVLSANVYWEEFVDTSLFSALKRPQKIHDFHLYFAPTLPYMPLPNSSNSVAWTCSSSTCLVRPLSGSSASASAPFSTTSEGASPVSCKRATFLLALYRKMTFTDLKKYTYLLPAISCGVLHTWTCTQRWRTASALARTTTGICTHSLKQISPVLWSDTGKTEKASPLCDTISDTLKDTFKDIQCMCLLYVCENSNDLSANVYWEKFGDTSLFSALKRQQKIHDFHLYFAPTLPYMPLPNSSNSVAWTCSSSTCLVRPLSGSSASASAPFSTTSEGASPVSCKRATFLLALYRKMTFTDLKKYTYLLPAISCGVLHTWTCTQRWRTASALARTTTGLCTHWLKQISPVLWSDTGKNRKGFAAVWHNFRYSQRYSQRHPCMCLLYVCENSNHLSANVYCEKFGDISLFSALKRPQKIHDFHLYFAPTLPYMPSNSSNPVAWTCSSSTCLVRPLSGSSASASAPFSTTSEGASPVSCKRATFLLALYRKMTFTDLKKYT